jgi:hypothetical protein
VKGELSARLFTKSDRWRAWNRNWYQLYQITNQNN